MLENPELATMGEESVSGLLVFDLEAVRERGKFVNPINHHRWREQVIVNDLGSVEEGNETSLEESFSSTADSCTGQNQIGICGPTRSLAA